MINGTKDAVTEAALQGVVMNEAILPDYLTVGEVSESLRLGPSTIYKLLKENKLPARKIRRKVAYLPPRTG